MFKFDNNQCYCSEHVPAVLLWKILNNIVSHFVLSKFDSINSAVFSAKIKWSDTLTLSLSEVCYILSSIVKRVHRKCDKTCKNLWIWPQCWSYRLLNVVDVIPSNCRLNSSWNLSFLAYYFVIFWSLNRK